MHKKKKRVKFMLTVSRPSIPVILYQTCKHGCKAFHHIYTVCHHKQKTNWYMVYLWNSPTIQPPFQHYCHLWPSEACTHLFFFFSQRHSASHFQESAGKGRKHTTHSKGVVMGKDHKTVYCLNPAGFAHSRLAESFNETHPVIFPFLLKAHELTGLTFPLPFLASVSFNYHKLNQRQESTPEWNVTVWQHRN